MKVAVSAAGYDPVEMYQLVDGQVERQSLSNPMSTSRFVLLSALMLTSSRSIAEQPIFGEMPRWAGGWGVQARHERRDGDTDSQWLHVDGVYTWERWIRVTAKVPFRIDESMGIGTPTLALPLKRYFNLDGRSGSWTLAPQWFVPIANPNSNARPERFKLSAGYETEAYKTTWQDQLGSFDEWTDLCPAPAPGHRDQPTRASSSGHLKIKGRARLRSDGGYSARIGPTFYWRINDTWHAQIVYKHTLLSEGYAPRSSLKTGIAVVF